MPRLITKEEATWRINQERSGAACALCALVSPDASRYTLLEGRHCVALLPRYARQWGHAMIVLRRHAVNYGELSAEEWSEANGLALRIAQTIERVLRPVRCYIASLGAAEEHPMTFPHLHVHVIPTYQNTDTPSTILTTKQGVLIAEDDEWRALHRQLLEAW